MSNSGGPTLGGRWSQHGGPVRSAGLPEGLGFHLKLLVMGIAFTLFFFLPWAIQGSGSGEVGMSWDVIDGGKSGWMSTYVIYSLLLGIAFIVLFLTKVEERIGVQVVAVMALIGVALLFASVFGGTAVLRGSRTLPASGALAILGFMGVVLLACGCRHKSVNGSSVAASVLIGFATLLVLVSNLIPVKVGGSTQMPLVFVVKMVFNPKGLGVPSDLRALSVLMGLYSLSLFVLSLVSLVGAADTRPHSKSPSMLMTALYRYFQFYIPVLLLAFFVAMAVGSDGKFILLALLWFSIGLLFQLELLIEGARSLLGTLEGQAPAPRPAPAPQPVRPDPPRPVQPRPQPPRPSVVSKPAPQFDMSRLPSDVQARLAKVEEMKNKGMITASEYDDQRKRILAMFS
jgi:hypothetical protein